jgi:hypothetical protein
MELEEDLLDNGLLDCTRVNPTPVFYQETTEQLNKRVLAQWDGFCSFEASSDWMQLLKTNYGIDYLLDINGDVVQ